MVEAHVNPELVQQVTESALGLYALSMAFSYGLKSRIRERQEYKCDCCGEKVHKPSELQVHHRIPRALGGPDRIENAVGLCQDCHREVDREAFMGLIYPQTHDTNYYFPQGNT